MSIPVTIEEVVAAVSVEFGIPHDLIMGRCKTLPVRQARQVAVWLVVKLTRLTYHEIGDVFDRDRTTIRHSFRVIEAAVGTNEAHGAQADDLRYRFVSGIYGSSPTPALPQPPAFGRGVALTRLALGYLRDYRDNTTARQLLAEALDYLTPDTTDREAA